ncbi:MAG: NTP transferase domain-containing protein [Pseudomonadota bacterium]
MNKIGIVILAAGKGTRMKSDLPKVLHQIHGRSMISLVLQASVSIAPEDIVVVVGHQSELVKADVQKNIKVEFALQKVLLGTGDAVRTALPYLREGVETVLILCGDTPLIRSETLIRMIDFHHKSGNDITLLGVDVNNPSGYGRLITNPDGSLNCIREQADASDEERRITTVNSGIYCVSRRFLIAALTGLTPDNAQKEYYLTDIVGIATQSGYRAGVFQGTNPNEVMGVNTLEELLMAQEFMEKL